MVSYSPNIKQEYIVTIMNLSDRTICVPPKTIVSEIQQVLIDDSVLQKIENSKPVPDILKQVNTGSEISKEQQKKLIEMLHKHVDIFSTSDSDIGECKVGKHRTDLTDNVPFKEKFRRIPLGMIDELRAHLEDLVSAGIIRKSYSPWASPVVLCRKKNGKLITEN